MTHPLTNCRVCFKSFSQDAIFALSKTLIFTDCFHIFHKFCLDRWINTPIKDCPICRAIIYKKKLGDEFEIYWKIFLKALQFHPKTVKDILKKSDFKNDSCSDCSEDFPLIPLRYDTDKKRLVHEDCDFIDRPSLVIQDIVKIVKEVIKKDDELDKMLKTPPPSLASRIIKVLILGSISIGTAALIALFVKKRFF